jgi:hypothetical protein
LIARYCAMKGVGAAGLVSGMARQARLARRDSPSHDIQVPDQSRRAGVGSAGWPS